MRLIVGPQPAEIAVELVKQSLMKQHAIYDEPSLNTFGITNCNHASFAETHQRAALRLSLMQYSISEVFVENFALRV